MFSVLYYKTEWFLSGGKVPFNMFLLWHNGIIELELTKCSFSMKYNFNEISFEFNLLTYKPHIMKIPTLLTFSNKTSTYKYSKIQPCGVEI